LVTLPFWGGTALVLGIWVFIMIVLVLAGFFKIS
jgi:hypothetical protein